MMFGIEIEVDGGEIHKLPFNKKGWEKFRKFVLPKGQTGRVFVPVDQWNVLTLEVVGGEDFTPYDCVITGWLYKLGDSRNFLLSLEEIMAAEPYSMWTLASIEEAVLAS
jgi:hypothetical protein